MSNYKKEFVDWIEKTYEDKIDHLDGVWMDFLPEDMQAAYLAGYEQCQEDFRKQEEMR